MEIGLGLGLTAARGSGGGGGGGGSLPLDSAPASVAAFATRKLRSAYAGSCLRVRRSSDNAEADIGFSGDALDVAALLAFCGAGNGFVVTWYDQSGNGNDATQATAANQPQIVTAGALTATDPAGYPAMEFNGSSRTLDFVGAADDLSGDDVPSTLFLKFSANNVSGSYDVFAFANSAVSNARHMLRLNATNGRFVLIRGDSAGTVTATGDGAASGAGWDLWSQVFPGTAVSWWVDGVQDKAAAALDVGSTTFTHATIGARRSGGTYSGYFPGKVSAALAFASALSDPARQALETAL